MDFVYRYSKLPKNERTLIDINTSASMLHSKLSNLDLDSIHLSDYMKNYVRLKLNDLNHNLQIASYILSWSLAKWTRPYNLFHFIEYGAGSGFVGLLAKELGMRVTYNDIYDVSLNDATKIAKATKNTADYYLRGDIDDVLSFLKVNNLDCNAIVSTDVVEHIYNIEDFLYKISLLPGDHLSIVMSSGANPYHPYIRRKLMKKQIELENVDRQKEFGHKERDSLRSYRSIRKELISDYLARSDTNPGDMDIEVLVNSTRGLAKDDIYATLSKYIVSKELPPHPSHPTNTCDPYTGNWAEHLMNPFSLARILERHGFIAKVLPGFYGASYKRLQRYVGKSLDLAIHRDILGEHVLRLAPFYTIYGVRTTQTRVPA